ncbi:MAG: DUF1553 domain-containing protein [Planctomycetota bacterium]|nr:DUF1553 domain-containing protein [Planctomycetota bacterium]
MLGRLHAPIAQLALSLSLASVSAAGVPAPDTEGVASGPDFSREILPILSDKCFTCHGPDHSSRRGGLRLDRELEARESGVLDRAPDGSSELGDRILDEDPLFRMPPPEAKHELEAEERELLLRWVAAGAPYGRHRAFDPLPASVAVPEVSGPWALSDIDRFVAASRDATGLSCAPAAAPARWLRRVTFDLTGLPPTPEQVDAFLADPSPEARARVVDRLLSSPSFGERMATPWLDVARYADSYGYQADLLSPTWPYRDWVVSAFNQNKPFDRFLIEQLAGDLLDDAGAEERLATAFNRLHRMTNEGGSVEEERRHESIVDRVETLGTAFMGLTLGCARCHDHKYDPITQADFFGLYAYFSGIDEWGMYHDSSRVPTPSLLLETMEQASTLASLRAAVCEAEEALRAALDEPVPDLAPGAPASQLGPDPSEPGPFGPVADLRFEAGEELDDGRTRFGSPDGPRAVVGGALQVVAPADDAPGGVLLDGDAGLQVDDIGPWGPTDPFTLELALTLPEGTRDGVLVHRTGGTDVGYFGFDLCLVDGYLRARQVRFWPGNAAAVVSEERVPTGRPVRLVFAQDGSGWADGMKLWVDGEPGQEELVDALTKPPGIGGKALSIGARFRGVGIAGGVVHRVRRWDRCLDAFGVGRALDPAHGLGEGGLLRDDARAVASRHLAHRSERLTGLRRALAGARSALLQATAPVLEVPVMAEAPWAEPFAHVLERGEYDAPRTEANRVPRRAPIALGPPADLPDRLALASWLVSPDHPLTARVAVNRLWMMFFGRGLVATAGDFGLQGARPTHPELLDWLARRFVDSGWDVKALCREIALSATYGQDSAGSSADLDPDNALLARGPKQRLTAEMLRDTVLFASGLLEGSVGGPPVSPYQPAGLWRESNSMSPAYRQSVGEGLYRRSLYSVVKRTAPLPNMLVLDAPTREASCARREQTSTPLQGLVLLNDVQFVEASRVLAERVMGESAADAERVAAAFRRLAGREPDETEARILEDLLVSERGAFEAAPEEAAALVGVGDSVPGVADSVELASLTAVVQTILNLDAVVNKR